MSKTDLDVRVLLPYATRRPATQSSGPPATTSRLPAPDLVLAMEKDVCERIHDILPILRIETVREMVADSSGGDGGGGGSAGGVKSAHFKALGPLIESSLKWWYDGEGKSGGRGGGEDVVVCGKTIFLDDDDDDDDDDVTGRSGGRLSPVLPLARSVG